MSRCLLAQFRFGECLNLRSHCRIETLSLTQSHHDLDDIFLPQVGSTQTLPRSISSSPLMIHYFFRLADCLRFSFSSTSEEHQLGTILVRPFPCVLLAPYSRTWPEPSHQDTRLHLGTLALASSRLASTFLSLWIVEKLSSFQRQ